MKILLIGNFAPPYEEENLQNISLFYRLEKDGHECSVINISENPATDKRFINTAGVPGYVMKLLKHCRGKDIVHFATKGYLRIGLLKLMASVFIGSLFRVKTVITIHSELFSLLGQMRSPFGGTQTLNTSFSMADKIIFNDKDTYDVASMYRKKSNFELVHPFIHLPEETEKSKNLTVEKIRSKNKLIVFSNIKQPSFLFDMLIELSGKSAFPPDTDIAISFSEKPASRLRNVIGESSPDMKERIIFLEPDDLRSTLTAYSKAEVIVRTLSCDGTPYFKDFAVSVKKVLQAGNNILFPCGFVLIKEGKTADMCLKIIDTLHSAEETHTIIQVSEDPYEKLLTIYKELLK